ncbi:MAG TPA: C40 family peptidase [Pricia sp.]|nr:C40 family peptidase [Pricia sp.]
MTRKILYISLVFLSVFLFTNCGSKKKTTYGETRKVSVSARKEPLPRNEPKTAERHISKRRTKADDIIDTALQFSGVRYKYGGTTKKGMDCSGLLYVAFGENGVKLPRVSYHMAEEGKRIRLQEVAKGDLLFFRTSKGAKRINHVGMVVAVENNEIKFIHASSSRGVIVSSLREGYWNSAFVRATRVL